MMADDTDMMYNIFPVEMPKYVKPLVMCSSQSSRYNFTNKTNKNVIEYEGMLF